MKRKIIISIIVIFLILVILNSGKKEIPIINDTLSKEFSNEQEIQIVGYDSNIMEVHISRDNKFLFFNNKEGPTNKDLYYAIRINETAFQFQGEINNINTKETEGTPSLINNNIMYLISTRHYENGTIFYGEFIKDSIINLQQIQGTINIKKAGWLNMDVWASIDNNYMYTSYANFRKGAPPIESNIRYAIREENEFNIPNNEKEILKNINTDYALQYAPELSDDNLEIFYTELTRSKPMVVKMYHAKRKNIYEPFEKPLLIKQAKLVDENSFFEAPTISSDGKKLYYHKMKNGVFKVFMMTRD